MRERRTLILILLFFLVGAPSYGQGVFEEGLKQYNEENYEEALPCFLEARKADPTSTKIAFFTGLAYKRMENYKEAVPYLRDAVTLSPPIKEALVELVDALNQIDNTEEAKKWIEVGEKEGIQPGRMQFFKGTILLKEKKYEQAIAAFEQAKRSDTSLTQAAEFQIANAYIQTGKWKEARSRLSLANRLDPNSDIGTYARDYESLVTDKMEQERPWRFRLSLGYKYDTNVVAMPTSGAVTDLISGQRDAALNLTSNISYTAPFSFRSPYNLTIQHSLYADRYFRRDDYNTMTNVITATPGYNFSKFSFSVPLSYTYSNLQREYGTDFLNSPNNWFSKTWYLEQYGVTPTLRTMTSQNSVGELSGIYYKRRYNTYILTAGEADRVAVQEEESRDGEVFGGALGWTYFFKKGAGLLNLRYAYVYDRTQGDNWVNYDHRYSVIFLYPLIDRLKLQLLGDAAFTKYRYVHSIYDMKRRDDIYNGSIGLIYDIAKNVNVLAQYTYIRDKSNIDLYDYKREIFSISVEYRY